MLAVDNQISKQTIKMLNAANIKVVYNAKDERDEVWIENALNRGAFIFVSPDLDIPLYLDRNAPDCIWINVPQRLESKKQFGFIMKQLKKRGILK